MFDLINFFIHKNVIKISAHSIESSYYLANDNFDAQIKYEDGSIANIFYTTLGNNKLPKEYIEIFADGKIYIINNFQTLKVFNSTGNISYFKPNQGHLDELKIIAQSLKNNTLPIPIEDIIQATKISFEIQKQVNNKY